VRQSEEPWNALKIHLFALISYIPQGTTGLVIQYGTRTCFYRMAP